MISKQEPAAIQGFLEDTSNLKTGWTPGVLFPESGEELAGLLRTAPDDGRRYVVAGNGTGTTGGRIPFGDWVISMQRFDRIGQIRQLGDGQLACIRAGAGVMLQDLQAAAAAAGWFYQPDPTEKTCFVGSTIANNSSGSRSFRYGPTRNHVQALKIALPQGDIIDIVRGRHLADPDGRFTLDLPVAGRLSFQRPRYEMPATSKHNAGYWSREGMDLIDLFIGSEGTLGVILEAELLLHRAPANVFACLAYFDDEEALFDFVSRAGAGDAGVSPRAIELFDARALEFLRQSYPSIPRQCAGAVYIEQETSAELEERCVEAWMTLMEACGAPTEHTWAALDAEGLDRLREFRHRLPVLVNEWLSRQSESKVSTDMAVPDAMARNLFDLYRRTCEAEKLTYIIFGHIGNAHLHLNILPRNRDEFDRAKALYRRLVDAVLTMGGTLSAEHGIGKLKSEYLIQMYGADGIREMVRVKKAFDPYLVLNIGNLIPKSFYESET